MSFALVSSSRFANHLTPPGHPERVARAHVLDAVASVWAERGVPVLAPRPATREELLRVHTAAYVDRIQGTRGGAARLDADTYVSPETADVAALAAGAAIVTVDAVLEGQAGQGPVRSALALVRPPGHHAEASRAMGFCIYNNIAIAAAHALARGLARVAIVDYDVHHGNGTQSAFYEQSRVLVISTHQFPFYPGTGSAGEVGRAGAEGFTVNVPLQAGATDADYALVFDRVVCPVLDAFRPDLLLVSAGFDAHMGDPIAMMRVSVAGFNAIACRMYDSAAAARCPMVFVTEGGYHLQALAACLDGLIRVSLADRSVASASIRPDPPVCAVSGGGPDAEPLTPDEIRLTEYGGVGPTGRGATAVDLVRSAQKQYWPGL